MSLEDWVWQEERTHYGKTSGAQGFTNFGAIMYTPNNKVKAVRRQALVVRSDESACGICSQVAIVAFIRDRRGARSADVNRKFLQGSKQTARIWSSCRSE
jgi:hypothetical protein